MNREERNIYAKKWYATNRERLLEKSRNHIKTAEQKTIHNIASRKYYEKNKEKHSILTRKWKNEHRIRKLRVKKIISSELLREKERLRYYVRKPKIQERNAKNKLIINIKHREYIIKKKQTDPLFKLRREIPGLIRISITRYGYSKKSKTYSILGCTWGVLKEHLESKFESWMNWENHGKYNGELGYGWDLDHIIPVSSAKSEEEILELNHYTNFQPLDGYINRYIKRNKVA